MASEQAKQEILALIEELKTVKHELYQGDYLRTWDLSDDTIRAVVLTSQILKKMWDNNISANVFTSGLAVSQFRDNSTRTRFSFASAASLLGLNVQDLDEEKSQISHGETVRETANMISFLTEVIGIRDDKFLGAGHTYQVEVAKALDAGVKEGVLPQRPCIVNLQCDEDHPTQSMSDLLHLVDHFGGVENLKGKKLAFTWAYSPSYGKPLSVPQGVIGLMSRFGMDIHLAHPEGYDLIPEIVDLTKEQCEKSGGKFTHGNSMEEAFKDADIIYPKSWCPFHIMGERTKCLRAGDKDGLNKLEQQALNQNKNHMDWTVTEDMVKLTKNADPLYLHCLPADLSGVSCEHGEIDGEIFERFRVDTYKEASHKPHVISSAVLLSRFEEAPRILKELVEENKPHRRV
ncbi:hypothetical protein GEMRC1_003638 [Eukaryota sp. GEM-RC1]